MREKTDILLQVRRAAEKKLLFLRHALRQMLRPDRMINSAEVRRVIAHGQIIEDYPEDPRGHSCLLSGFGEGNRPVHVVCSPKEDYLAIITAYIPEASEWSEDFKVRIKK